MVKRTIILFDDSQCGHRHAALALSENLSQILIFESCSKLAELETGGLRTSNLVSDELCGDSEACTCLKMTEVQTPAFAHRKQRSEKLCSGSRSHKYACSSKCACLHFWFSFTT